MSRATLCISVPQLDAVVNKIRDNERKRLKSPEIATRTAAHIPFIRHAEGEKGAPRRGGFVIKTARPTKERSGRELPLTAQ